MMKKTLFSFLFLTFLSFALAQQNVINVNFGGLLSGWNSPTSGSPSPSPTPSSVSGFVYGRTNDPINNNNVVAYKRDKNGLLWEIGRYSTNGKGVPGAVDPLASQDSLIFSPNKNYILSVNGGSNTITVFKRNWDGGLTFASSISSYPGVNSSTPASLATWGNWVYVLNSGALTSIAGFSADWTTGTLTFLPGSQATFPGKYGQISFSPDGKFLITTGKADHFRVFPLDTSTALPTTLTGILSSVTSGLTPFSFVFDRTGSYALVALAFGGVGSFKYNTDGTLTTVQVINTTDPATCWIARNSNSNNFYAVNAGKPSISAFTSNSDGTITLINGKTQISATATDPDVALFPAASVPLDLAITSDNHFLYVLLGGRGTIAGFWIRPDGTLLSRGETELQLPGFNGINGILAD